MCDEYFKQLQSVQVEVTCTLFVCIQHERYTYVTPPPPNHFSSNVYCVAGWHLLLQALLQCCVDNEPIKKKRLQMRITYAYMGHTDEKWNTESENHILCQGSVKWDNLIIASLSNQDEQKQMCLNVRFS